MNRDPNSIVLAYIAVHQMFQLALAAEEIGQLDALYCSMVDRPGKWGRIAGRFFSGAMFIPLGVECLPIEKIRELPWGMIQRKLPALLLRKKNQKEDYLSSNKSFCKSVAKRLARHNAKVFVATESCALECFLEAKRLGMTCVLDCPGIPESILAKNLERARKELGIQIQSKANNSLMEDRKSLELDLADHVLLCSELQFEKLVERGIDSKRLTVNPLWVDDCFLNALPQQNVRQVGQRLNVLYAGAISTAKGVPYLIDAFMSLQKECQLTLCGTVDREVGDWAGSKLAAHRVIPRVARRDLPTVFRDHDVLVLPSLGDSFGFIALEAMASGLPVIVTDAVGVPIPKNEWRVPANCARSIADRLLKYAHDRELLKNDSQIAQRFACTFTPQQYRHRAGQIFSRIIDSVGERSSLAN